MLDGIPSPKPREIVENGWSGYAGGKKPVTNASQALSEKTPSLSVNLQEVNEIKEEKQTLFKSRNCNRTHRVRGACVPIHGTSCKITV